MNWDCCSKSTDNGLNPYAANIKQITIQNQNFRTAVWTGCYLQMTLMCIPEHEEIGLEFHADTDQFIRIEQGKATVKMGKCKNRLDFQQNICEGDGVCIPAGTWHNIINIEKTPLKISSIYAPPNHLKGTIHQTKSEAEKEEY